MRLPFLGGNPLEFPPSHTAMEEPNGLLAAGGDLSLPRLLTAYSLGIFPWFQDSQPILWWTPNPRLVLYPGCCRVSRSMAKFMGKSNWQIKIDTCFDRVIEACASPRAKANGTWITEAMQEAYRNLYKHGFAHSIEVFDREDLVGGLYGVSLGRIFFGESMFSRASNGSKMAIIHLSKLLHHWQFKLIDCQVSSSHLLSLGAEELSRQTFELQLSEGVTEQDIITTQQYWYSAKGQIVTIDGHIRNQAV